MGTEMGYTEQALADFITESTTAHNPWIAISKVRNAFPEWTKEAIDTALRSLHLAHGYALTPESNQKALSTAVAGGALYIGGMNKHYVGRP